MTKYLSGEPFSVSVGTPAYAEGWERIFGKKKEPPCRWKRSHDNAVRCLEFDDVKTNGVQSDTCNVGVDRSTKTSKSDLEEWKQQLEAASKKLTTEWDAWYFGPVADPQEIDLGVSRIQAFVEKHSVKSDIRKQVENFHRAMGQPVGEVPVVPDSDRIRFRLGLVTEEFCELIVACGVARGAQLEQSMLQWLERQVIEMPAVDIVEVADALGDLDYVIEGTRLAFGINGKPIADEIHRSNMSKADGGKREDGKRLKPEGWTPPDVAGELAKQGWKP